MPDPVAGADGAETCFVERDGVRFAWREYGAHRPGEPPLVLLDRFRATMDDWDPALLNALARGRRVIAFHNRGVGESGARRRPPWSRRPTTRRRSSTRSASSKRTCWAGAWAG